MSRNSHILKIPILQLQSPLKTLYLKHYFHKGSSFCKCFRKTSVYKTLYFVKALTKHLHSKALQLIRFVCEKPHTQIPLILQKPGSNAKRKYMFFINPVHIKYSKI